MYIFRLIGLVVAGIWLSSASHANAQIKRVNSKTIDYMKKEVAEFENVILPQIEVAKKKCDDPEGFWDITGIFSSTKEASEGFRYMQEQRLIPLDDANKVWKLNDSILTEHQAAVQFYDAACQEPGSAGRLPECFSRWLGKKGDRKLAQVQEEHELTQKSILSQASTAAYFKLMLDVYENGRALSGGKPEDLSDDVFAITKIADGEKEGFRFISNYSFTSSSPLYNNYLGRVAEVYRRCVMRARQFQFHQSIQALEKWSKTQDRSSPIAAELARFRVKDPGFREGLKPEVLAILARVEGRLLALRANEEAARRAELIRLQEQALKRAEELAAKERAENIRIATAKAVRKSNLRHLADSSAGVPAPAGEELLEAYIKSLLRHQQYMLGPRSNEVGERGVGGVSFYQTLALDAAQCTRLERNTYRCGYQVVINRRVSDDGSLASFGGSMFTLLGLDVLTNYMTPAPVKRNDVFVFHQGGWWSATLDRSIDRAVRIEAAAASRQGSSSISRYDREPMWEIDWTDPANPSATPNLAYRP